MAAPAGAVAAQRALAAIGRGTERVLLAICGVLVLVLTVNVFLEVVVRYVVKMPLPWTEEVARFSMVWLGILAAAVAARNGLHFSFRWGVMALPDHTRRMLRVFVNILVVGFLVVLLRQSIAYLDIVADQTAVATEINMRIPYGGLPVGLSALLLMYLLEIGDAVLAVWTGQSLSLKEAAEEASFRQMRHPDAIVPAMPLPGAD